MLCLRSIFAIGTALALGLSHVHVHATEAPPSQLFCVQKYGAVGNGTTLNTVAIQDAIDACSREGGGLVYFSPGVYLSGGVRLKDNVRLMLEAGAVLRGSPNPQDYPQIVRNSNGHSYLAGGSLIYAEGVRNASVEGRGTIDGQGREFWFDEMFNRYVKKPKPARPRMIYFLKGESLLIRDVTLINSPSFTVWLMGCNNVNVDGITIRNPHDGPNTDGLDIDCSSNVRVSNCLIDGGDDAIAIKGSSGILGEDKPCENITVTNCNLVAIPACGIKVGYEGDSLIRNCSFTNLTITDSDIGISILGMLPPDAVIRNGSRCENIVFSDIVMRRVNRAIYFWMGNLTNRESQVQMKDILVSNVVAESQFGSYIGGFSEKRAENVTLSNIRLKITGEMPIASGALDKDCCGWTLNPCALHCVWADGLQIRDLDIDLRETKGVCPYGVFCEEVHNSLLRDIRTQGLAARQGKAVIGLRNATVAVRDCDREPQVPEVQQREQ